MSRAAEAADHWMELLHGADGASTIEALVTATEKYQLYYAGAPYCTVLRPTFVEASTWATIKTAAEAVTRAIRIVADRSLRDPSFRRQLGYPEYIDELLDLDRDTSRPAIMARFDGLFDQQGHLQFIEFNSEPGGLIRQFESNRVFEQAPIGRVFARRFPFTIPDPRPLVVDALVAETRERGRPLPTALAVGTPLSPRTLFDPGSMGWVLYAGSRGCRVMFVDPAQLDVREDGVFAEGERIDIVMFGMKSLLTKTAVYRPLCDALRRGVVSSLSGVSQAVLGSNKLAFEALSDPAHDDLFDHETQRALRQHIPWTRRVRECRTTLDGKSIDLLPFVIEHRERFVLKPAAGMQGEGVILGWTCDRATWERAFQRATRRPFVVQERVESTLERFPMLVDGKIVEEMRAPDFCPFIWNGRIAAGAFVRVGRAMHNVSGGGSVVAQYDLP